MVRLGERRIGCRTVAELSIDAEVGRPVLPDERGALLGRLAGRRHRRQDLVIDLDPFGCVERRHQVSAITAATASPTKRALSVASSGIGVARRAEPSRLLSGTSTRPGMWAPVGIVPMPSASRSAPVSTSTTPRRGPCRRRVDAFDARMGVRRAHDHRMKLPREHHVAGIVAGALDQAVILFSLHRLTNASCGDRLGVHVLPSSCVGCGPWGV